MYSIFILHQTTTPLIRLILLIYCILSLFYIKPQLNQNSYLRNSYCILSLFYIKPQLFSGVLGNLQIVFYLYSTSNHNKPKPLNILPLIVFYLYSTSNHNATEGGVITLGIVFYLYSTSNHNSEHVSKSTVILYSIFILHQTTTLL